MATTASKIALFTITLADLHDPDGISNLKLQKLLYYMQGFHLAALGEPLFREKIEAWEHGPVVPPVWREYAPFGRDPIRLRSPIKGIPIFSPRQFELLEEVYHKYGQFSGTRLRNETHKEAPWKTAWAQGQNTVITHESLRTFFKTRIKNEPD